jgi:hypothetical protein
MHSTLKQKQTDDPHDIVVVAPDVVRVAPADEELSNLLHDAARHLSDAKTRTGSDFAAGASVPPVETTFRPAAVNYVVIPGDRWSMARRVARALAALLLATCICVAAIAWQYYGDAAKRIIAKWAPQLVLTSSQALEKPALAAQPTPPDAQVDAANVAPAQPAPLTQTAAEGAAPTAAAPSADSAQSLQSMARDLASAAQEIEQLKASVEQLKASQQQLSRDLAKASEQNLRPRQSAPPPRAAATPAHKPTPPFPPRQAAAAPTSPQAAAAYVPRPVEPQPQTTAAPPADPELASVPRPPMPVR